MSLAYGGDICVAIKVVKGVFFVLLYNGMKASALRQRNDGSLGRNEALKVEVGVKSVDVCETGLCLHFL